MENDTFNEISPAENINQLKFESNSSTQTITNKSNKHNNDLISQDSATGQYFSICDKKILNTSTKSCSKRKNNIESRRVRKGILHKNKSMTSPKPVSENQFIKWHKLRTKTVFNDFDVNSVNLKPGSKNKFFNEEEVKNKFQSSKIKCSNCKKCFASLSLLNEHLKDCDNKFESSKVVFNDSCLKCQNCDGIFDERIKLETHVLENQCKNFKQYTCDMCKKSFNTMSHLKRHIVAHLNASFKCKTCDFKSPNKESLVNHCCDSNHESKSVCHICKKIFKSNATFTRHVKKHKNNGIKYEKSSKVLLKNKRTSKIFSECKKSDDSKQKYECDNCGLKFFKLNQLKFHILNTHQGINYQCEKCSVKFTNEEEYKAHVNKQNCKPEEPSVCKICNKVFSKKDYLKKHQYMHTNVLFKCKYCYCAFMKEKNYTKHIEKMNCSKSARKIRMAEFNFKKCRICNNEYENEEQLLDHFKLTHPGENPHQCFCCESCLPTFQALQDHIHQHNIQKYTCSICGKPYTSQEGFRKHRLKHKGAEFKCKFCCAEFLNENRYKFHEKTCKKNPESGHKISDLKEKAKKKDEKPKQSRQLNWESRIIVKHLRVDPKLPFENQQSLFENKNENSIASTFFDESETEIANKRGWFDNYYKTEEDDIAFGLKKDNNPENQNFDSFLDIPDFEQTNPDSTKKNKEPAAINFKDADSKIDNYENEDFGNYSEGLSELSTSDSSEEEEDLTDLDQTIDYNPKKCRLCIVSFGQEYELLHHFIKNHPGENAHKCPHCEVQSPLFAQLKEHMKTHGIGIGIFNCDNCSKKFRSEKKMKSHNIRCKGLNMESGSFGKLLMTGEEHCKKCGKKFQTKFGYKRHKQLCKGKKVKPKKSTLVLENSEKLKENFTESYIQTENPDTSDVDEEVFDKGEQEVNFDFEENNSPNNIENTNSKPVVSDVTKDEQVNEKKKEVKDGYVGEPPLDSFPCRLCDKKFQYERGIVMHFKSTHPGHKPLICHVCNMHLADKLKEHLKTHGIGEEFICGLCGKRFNQKFLSKIHEMWHEGIEFKCNNCKQKFLNKEKMEKHIRENRCSNRQSLMRLPCDICGKSYRSKFGLSKHYITHTPKELRPVKNKMNCEFCGKWFENNNGLQRHRRIHTGERPFCCRFCPKAFAQEGNCKAHERIHTGESKPKKKKSQTETVPSTLPPNPQQQTQIVPAIIVPQATVAPNGSAETILYPGHINLYIYTGIDSNGIVH